MIIKKVMPKVKTAKKRVAAYCRVSTLRENQDESFETQQKYYAEMVQHYPSKSQAGRYLLQGQHQEYS